MNCAACNQPINRFGGYYLVGNLPYCNSCFQRTDRYRGIRHSTHPLPGEYEHDNLLEAFRAYQERERKAACLRH